MANCLNSMRVRAIILSGGGAAAHLVVYLLMADHFDHCFSFC